MVKSDIDKHKDALGNLTEDQQFLLGLSDREFLDARNKRIE